MRRVSALITVLLLIGSLLFMVDCNEDDEVSDDRKCSGNSAPAVNAINLTVNGSLIYEGYAFNSGDKVNFSIDYKDLDCNLNGGEILMNWNGGGFKPISQIAVETPCEGTYPNDSLSFSKTVTGDDIDFGVKIADNCGKESNAMSGVLSIGHAPRIMEAYWIPEKITQGETAKIKLQVCDSDSDLFSGEIFLYKHGSLAPLMEWKGYHFGLSDGESTENCFAPALSSPPVEVLKGECFDIAVIDEAGNNSGRYEGEAGENGQAGGFCISVTNP